MMESLLTLFGCFALFLGPFILAYFPIRNWEMTHCFFGNIVRTNEQGETYTVLRVYRHRHTGEIRKVYGFK